MTETVWTPGDLALWGETEEIMISTRPPADTAVAATLRLDPQTPTAHPDDERKQ